MKRSGSGSFSTIMVMSLFPFINFTFNCSLDRIAPTISPKHIEHGRVYSIGVTNGMGFFFFFFLSGGYEKVWM